MNPPVDVLGLEHIYLTVSSLAVSEAFYDTLLVEVLGFRKSKFALGDEHVDRVQRLNRRRAHVECLGQPANRDAGARLGAHVLAPFQACVLPQEHSGYRLFRPGLERNRIGMITPQAIARAGRPISFCRLR